jgi:hypothetical protein
MSRMHRRLGVVTPLVAILLLLFQALPVSAASPSQPASSAATPKSGTLIRSIYVSEADAEAAGLVGSNKVRSSSSTGGPSISPQAGCLFNCIHVRNVAFWYNGQVLETTAILNNTTANSATLTLSKTLSVANSFSANVSVSASVVTAGVGFSVTSSVSIGYSASITVPGHTCEKILAYELYKVYTFKVWQEPFIGSDVLIGNGWAQNRSGVRYDIVYC